MPIFIGLLILCAAFIVFGSKTEEASVLYYDPPGASEYIETRADEGAGVEASEMVDQGLPMEDVPADAPSAEDAAAIARGIYDQIEL